MLASHLSLLSAVSIAVSGSTPAIATTQSESIALRSGQLDTSSLGLAKVTEQIELAAVRTDINHFVIRLHTELDASERDALKKEGVSLLTCLGAKTWIAAIAPKAVTDSAGLADRIAWVGELPTEAKLHPFLAAGNVPEWTIQKQDLDAFLRGEGFDPVRVLKQLDEAADPVIALYVLAHRDVALGEFLQEVTGDFSVEALSQLVTVNGLLLRMPMAEVRALAELDSVLWIEPALPQFTTTNDSNRVNVQAEEVWSAPYGLSGAGVSVMVYDGGYADASHADFSGRLTVRDGSGQSTHATHVAGTVGGNGANSNGQHSGMAPEVIIESYGFEQEGGLGEGFLYTDPGDIEADYSDAILNHGVVISNNSIGTNTANNGFPCEWTGDYGVTSSVIDSVVKGSLGSPIRIVWANGNERASSRCGDLYNTTAPPACAKNHITVGALNSDDDSVTYFTSWGPADDGRIKPDISAPGCQSGGDGGVTSTFPGGGYGTYCGTSMASPTVTGISALIIEDWRQQFPGEGEIPNSALKALLANSGDDLGNVGPDCQYGFGTVRARQAIDSLRAEGVALGEVGDGGIGEHLVIVSDSESELRITLAWDDVPGAPLAVSALVNDLDLVVTSPSGDRVYVWTIDPANPSAPATQTGEDHINNIEQVSVASPETGAWRIQVVGYSVPVGPQAYSLVATPNPLSCSSTGVAGFGGSAFQPNSLIPLTVVDCDLNLNDEVIDVVDVFVGSDDEPTGQWVTLVEEDPVSAVFSGSIQIGDVDSEDVLLALDGSKIVLEYTDAMDANGNENVTVTDSANIDGSVAAPQDVSVVSFTGNSATVRVVSEEPVRIQILYGLSCDSLLGEVSGNTFSTDQELTIPGLEDNFSYAFRVQLTDQAGNTLLAGDGDGCFEFTVPDALDFYAEQFSGGIDLVNHSVLFEPIASADFYIPCTEEISTLPVDPSAGSTVNLSDDSSTPVTLPFSFNFYGEDWDSIYVGSNGFITFGAGSSTYSESLSEHFSLPRIALVFDDLNPSVGGRISTRAVPDGFAITWEDVPEYSTNNSNTFQAVLYSNGSMRLSWLELDSSDCIAGLSPGYGLDPTFVPNDLSEESGGCVARPPQASDIAVSTNVGTPIDITLNGSDDGEPLPLVYVIESLPNFVLRDIATGEQITTVPYVLGSGNGPHVTYQPPPGWEGVTNFLYYTDDGGTPPEGGRSESADVEITVSAGPSTVLSFSMDEDPGWTLEGDWSFGVPQGQGGQYGNADPTSGFTGTQVMGYALDGDYGNNLPEYSATTQSIDCSELTDVTLEFMRWLNVEQPAYDHALIQVSVGGGAFQTIWENTAEITDSSWSLQTYDLSDLADGQSDVRIRWVMGTTDGSWQYSGWNLDDVRIIAIAPPAQDPADLNGDGLINGADLAIMLGTWGACEGCVADLNFDGLVNGADLAILLGAWSEGSMLAFTGGTEIDGVGIGQAQQTPVELMPLINDEWLAPSESGGLVIAPHGYIQLETGVLDVELSGLLPVEEHDLVLVPGEAVLGGELQLRFPDLQGPVSGTYVVLLADRVLGAFDVISTPDLPVDESVSICLTERAVIVRRGFVGMNHGSGEPALPHEALALLDAIGMPGPAWDLDSDGIVSLKDLSILLREGVHCNE